MRWQDELNENYKPPTGRGGKRTGAGRKASPDALKRKTITIRLPAWVIDQLPAKVRGGVVEAALRGYLQLTPPSSACPFCGCAVAEQCGRYGCANCNWEGN